MIMSICSIIVVMVICTFFIFETFSRSNINIIYGKDILTNPTANLSNMPLVLKVISPISGKTLPNQNSLLNISAVFVNINTIPNRNGTYDIKIVETNIPLEKCDLNKHFENYSNYFTTFPELEKSFCFYPKSANLTLFGDYFDRSKNLSQLQIFVNKCVNNNINNYTCQNSSTINRALENIFLSVSFIDYQVNHNNIYDPKTTFLNNKLVSISSTVFKKIINFKQNTYYKTDYGYIFQDIEQVNITTNADSFENTDLRNNPTTPGNFCIFIMTISKDINIYFRSYGKIQTLLASMGGAINSVFLIAGLLARFISNKSYYLSLNNNLLKVPKQQTKNLFSKNKITTNNHNNNINNNNSNRNSFNNDSIKNSIVLNNKNNK